MDDFMYLIFILPTSDHFHPGMTLTLSNIDFYFQISLAF